MSKYGNLKRGDTRKDGMVFFQYRKRKNVILEHWITKSMLESFKKRSNNLIKLKYKNDLVYRKKHNDNKNKARRIKYKTDQSFHKKISDASVKYSRKKRNNDNIFRLTDNIRSLIGQSFKNNGFNKNNKTMQILGCTIPEFKLHIQSQFKEGMSWDNRTEWHIDHIMPVSMAKTEDEVIRLNHYKNLRPLWAHENLSKSDKTPEILVLF